MDTTSVFAPITKMAPQDDGTLLVHGKATGSDLDLDQQRCDASWLSRAVPEWFKIGNIREMHDGHRAVGKATEHDAREDGHYITAKIVDPVAVAKAQAGIFTGFSIGIKSPRVTKSADAPGGVITDGKIVEVSIVDSPCLPTATLTLVKSATPGMEINAADFDEERGLVHVEELVEKATDTDVDAKESDVPTLAETLAPEALEKLAAAAEPAELPATPAEPVETPAVEKAADETPTETAAAGGDGGDTAPAFDVDAAKALVDATLAKAEGDDVIELTPMAAPSDETVASVAIGLIAGLIQSEAQSMVDNPGEDLDIKCLLNAVDALRWFIRRERQEGDAGGESDAAPYEYLAATPDTEKAAETAEPLTAAINAVAEKAGEPVIKNELGDLAPAGAVTRTAADVEKTIDRAPVGAPVDPAPAEKAATPETTKAETVDTDGDALVKALSAALEKADSPLRTAFQNIVTASTETTAKAVESIEARLVKVEGMAVPGGPALRRTEVERTSARRNDLMVEAARYKALANGADDIDLRKGYATRAAQLEAELKALVA